MPTSLRGGRLAIVVLAGLAALLLLGRVLVSVWVEVLWFREVGFLPVFWTAALWGWGVRILAGLLVTVALFVNLRYAARTLSGIQIKRRFGNLEISEQLPRSYVFWAIAGISALLGLWFGASLGTDLGVHVLLASTGPEWGVVDPVLGADAAFYVFTLPLLQTAVVFLLVVTFLVFSVSTAAYAATGALRWTGGSMMMGTQARLHLGGIATVFILLVAARFWLGRFILLRSGNSEVQEIFGYADAHARLPGLLILTWVTVGAALLFFWGTRKNRLVPVISSLVTIVVAGVVLSQLYPAFVQRVQVEPNELERERPYIEQNIAFTRMGFGLEGMSRRPFRVDLDSEIAWPEAVEQFDGLPVWTENALLAYLRQEEAGRRYYEFSSIAVDRYDTAAGQEVVAVSVREVDQDRVEDPNWQNLHLRERYIAGMGAAAANATLASAEGHPVMYLSGIPPAFTTRRAAPEGLRLLRPEVFVGTREQTYAIVNASDSSFLVGPPAPVAVADGGSPGAGQGSGEEGVLELPVAGDSLPGRPGVDFPMGIRLGSFFRTLAFAWHFRDPNLLFAGEVDADSRFVFRREIVERVQRIAPFFRYPEEAYPVIHGGHVVWILEGFTATRAFPLSSPHDLRFRGQATWIRNSVKVTVDGLTGEVGFWAVPVHDPLLDAYRAAFPGLVRPIAEMPEGLRRHVRYSREMMTLQADVLRQYHQRTPAVFHAQQDVWELPQEFLQSTSAVAYQPEYGLYRLAGDADERFHLTTVFVPRGRQNLAGIMAGTVDDDGSPSLTLLDVPVEDQVRGPHLIESLIEQDPVISQQFSLWRTGGSEVWTGHLHLVPVGGRLLYMEPVYIAAAGDAVPQIQAFVVSDGRRVAMQPTLDGVIEVLAGERVSSAPSAVGPDTPGQLLLPGDPATWPADALDLLDRAEQRLREGDYSGFGAAIDELRDLLERLAGGG